MTNFLVAAAAARILQNGVSISQGTTDAWDKQWDTIFQSTLYTAIHDLAITFAIGSLLFYIVQLYRNLAFDEISEHLVELAWPLVVIAMLANNAALTANVTLAMRNVVDKTSTEILSTTLLQVKMEDAIQNAVLRGAIGSEITAQISQCQGLVGDSQKECLISANEQVQQTIRDFQQHTGIPGSFVKIGAAIEDAVKNNPLIQGGRGFLQGGVAGFFGGYLNSTVESVVSTVLLAFQWAFANILQISMLLTGLIGPLAVAGSLLPFGNKSIYTWVIGFFSLGMAQISYNIIVGMCAVVIVNADITDVNGFLVIVGLLGPALALAIATGGGMSVFNVITSGTAGAAKTAAQTVVLAV